MSEGIIGLETLDDIGRAIQYVEDSDDQYTPGQMAEAIERMKRTIIPMTFSANGEYDALLDDADGYNPVTVAVPQPEGTININQNGTVDVRQYANANVQVPQPSGAVNITQNGTTDVTQYATANVQVPNSYTAADEDKVVQSGALVAQTSRTVRENGTYDTTLNNELVVAIPSAAGTQGKLGANTTVDTLPEVYGPMGTLSDDYVTPVAYGTSNAVAINTAQAYEVKVVFRLTALPSAQAAIFGRMDASHPVPAMYVAAGGGNITYAVPEPPETQGGSVIYRTGNLYDTDTPLPLGTDITVGIRYAGGSSFEAWLSIGSSVTTKTAVDYTPYEGTGTVLLGYDQRQGNGIAGLSGATINTETTSITQGVNRLWGGVKGGGTANIQPLSVTQNGTYNPPAGVDGYAPVTVQVSGGGGDVPLLSRAQWEALSDAQKRAYGLVAVQDASGEYQCGVLYLGSALPEYEVIATGYGNSSSSVTLNIPKSGNLKLLVIAINSEASTKLLTIAAQRNGVTMQGTTLNYNGYNSQSENVRNNRVNLYDLDNISSGDAISIALSDANTYSIFVYAILKTDTTRFAKMISKNDGVSSGSCNLDGIVLYGTTRANAEATINIEAYTRYTQITTNDPGNGYRSSYILWLY